MALTKLCKSRAEMLKYAYDELDEKLVKALVQLAEQVQQMPGMDAAYLPEDRSCLLYAFEQRSAPEQTLVMKLKICARIEARYDLELLGFFDVIDPANWTLLARTKADVEQLESIVSRFLVLQEASRSLKLSIVSGFTQLPE